MNARSLANLVDTQLAVSPDKTALFDGLVSYTFRQLAETSNRAAAYLRQQGVRSGDAVAVIADKRTILVAWTLGIWKLGAVYAPVDPALPPARQTPLLRRLRPAAVVGKTEQLAALEVAVPTVTFDQSLVHFSADEHFEPPKPTSPAIIIHTSGSTGMPKGVILEHSSVLAYFDAHREVLRQRPDSRCLNTASFHYDVSIQDTFLPLSTGCYVRLCRELLLPQVILPLVEREQITQITAVSTILRMITGSKEQLAEHDLSKVETISTGAEVCSLDIIHAWIDRVPGIRVLNGYGPSEVNSVSVTFPITEAQHERREYYPIGRPHRGVLALLLDTNGDVVVQSGVRGELLLGGPQLMRGYLGDPDATRKAFAYIQGQRYYRTGDICYYDQDGELVFEGRRDFEVKLNGRRLNLKEVCEVIEAKTSVTGALCGLVDRGGQKHIGLVVRHPRPDRGIRGELVAVMNTHFPEYMRPTLIGVYEDSVQTTSGKTDTRLLLTQLEKASNVLPGSWFLWKDAAFALDPTDN